MFYSRESLLELRASLRIFFFPRDNFDESFVKMERIGRGSNGTVFTAVRTADSREVVVKKLRKKYTAKLWLVFNGEEIRFPVEAVVLSEIKNLDHIVQLLEYYETNHNYYYVFEYERDTMDLFKFVKGGRGVLSEATTKYLMLQLIEAVLQLWSRGFVHGDLKEENLLLNRRTLALTLIDFGAVETSDDRGRRFRHWQGSPAYTPPEVKRSLGFIDADSYTVFSLGAICYSLICGEVPFRCYHKVDMETLRRRLDKWPMSYFAHNFLLFCLHVDAGKRMRLKQLKQHPWLLLNLPDEAEVRREIEDYHAGATNPKQGFGKMLANCLPPLRHATSPSASCLPPF